MGTLSHASLSDTDNSTLEGKSLTTLPAFHQSEDTSPLIMKRLIFHIYLTPIGGEDTVGPTRR